MWDHVVTTYPTLDPGDDVNNPHVGQRVRVPWGPREVEGTIVAVFGTPRKRYVRIAVELADADELEDAPIVALPADAVEASVVA